MKDCPFCDLINSGRTSKAEHDYRVRYFEPLNPVTPGHMLFVPEWHATHPDILAIRVCMSAATRYAAERDEDFNLITSSGASATQTVAHVHIHYVPRRTGDGLALPWTGQRGDRGPTPDPHDTRRDAE